MAFSDYTFIYRDSLGTYSDATNPKFIASHTKCVAVETSTIQKHYNIIADFIWELNHCKTDAVNRIVAITDLKDIYIKD